jgi:hypothetical protein
MRHITNLLKARYEVQISILMLLSLFAQAAYPQEINRVRILSPSNGVEVGTQGVVTVSAEIKDDSHVWVLVHMALLPDQWWPQNPVVLGADGNWRSLVTFGERRDIGLDFEIAAATFNGEEEQKILEYRKHGLATWDWLPIKFPTPTSNVEILTVTKTSHD